MINIMDWIIEKLKLTDNFEVDSPIEEDDEITENSWFELVHKKNEKFSNRANQIHCKTVSDDTDCKFLIDTYKSGAICFFRINSTNNSTVQNLINYISGGIYALEGEVITIGRNIFLAVHSTDNIEEKKCR